MSNCLHVLKALKLGFDHLYFLPVWLKAFDLISSESFQAEVIFRQPLKFLLKNIF